MEMMQKFDVPAPPASCTGCECQASGFWCNREFGEPTRTLQPGKCRGPRHKVAGLLVEVNSEPELLRFRVSGSVVGSPWVALRRSARFVGLFRPKIRCQLLASIPALAGDSGGPIFRILDVNASNVEFIGITTAGDALIQQTSFAPWDKINLELGALIVAP